MYRWLLLLAILCYFSTASAQYATQSDWSGGPGAGGPVLNLGNEFFIDTDVFYACAFDLTLSSGRFHLLDGNVNGPGSVCPADIDGDGDSDVIGTIDSRNGAVCWWENTDGSGIYWTKHQISGTGFNNPNVARAADINGDGFIDVLGVSYNSSRISWFENVDGSGDYWVEHMIHNVQAITAHCSDVNGDGFIDVVSGAPYDNTIQWYENADGSGTLWIEHIVDDSFTYPRSVYSSDINSDGRTDIIGSVNHGGTLYWWENLDGSGTNWQKHLISTDATWSQAYSADINGDGSNDIIGMTGDRMSITWWENDDGSGLSWTQHALDNEFCFTKSVCSADLNGDGYLDLIGTSYQLYIIEEISWWENTDGSGTGWIKHELERSVEFAVSAQAADLNNDGCLDILAAAKYDDEIVWWDPVKYPDEGMLESSILQVQTDPDWELIDWEGTCPSGTSISMQVRASDDYNDMGSWSDTLFYPCNLEGILSDNDNYFQYRAILQTAEPDNTPTLDEVAIYWSPVSIADTTEINSPEKVLFPVTPNPTEATPEISFSLPQPGPVDISIIDLSGRTVSGFQGRIFSSGHHSVLIPEVLTPGIYFCRMISGEFATQRRFVVIY